MQGMCTSYRWQPGHSAGAGRLWACLLLCAASLWLTPEKADGAVLEPRAATEAYALGTYSAYHQDTSGQQTLADIRSAATAFTPVRERNDLNFGYTNAITWLRAELANRTDRDQQWMVVFDYPFLDHITHYQVTESSSQLFEGGSHLPVNQRATAWRQAVFPLALGAGETTTLFSRVETAGSKVLNYRLMTPAAFYAQNDRATFWLAAYFGMLMALGIYHLMLFVGLKEQVFLHYALFLFSFTFAITAFNGIGTMMLWSSFAEEVTRLVAVGFVLTSAMATRFAQSFLNTCLHCPRWHSALTHWREFCWIALAVVIFLPPQPALKLMDAVGLTTSLLLLACSAYGSLRRFPGARMFLLGWAALVTGACIFALRNAGIVPANFITLHGVQIGSALEMLLFALALASRFHQLKRQKEQAQAAVLDTLKSHEAQLEAQVAARTEALEYLAHHDLLTGILNRHGFEHGAEAAFGKARKQRTPLGLLMLDLDRFKPINDQYGHAAGDFVLKQVANRLKHLTRPGDLCARFGGDEFIMLLDNMGNDPVALHHMHTRIMHAVRQPIRLPDGTRVSVGASIGASVLDPEDSAQNLESMMQEADGSMYAAKPPNPRSQTGTA